MKEISVTTIKKIRQLNNIQRCQLYSTLKPTSVAEHSYHVGVLSMFIYHELKNTYDINFEKLISMALTHDIEEVILSDIPYTIKKHIESELQHILKKSVYDEFFNAPDWFIKYIIYPDDGSIEYKILKLADMVELVYYCMGEFALGNKTQQPMFNRAISIAQDLASSINSSIMLDILNNVVKD